MIVGNLYYEQVVGQLLVFNEELEKDTVKDTLQEGTGKANENKKQNHDL